MLGRAVFVTENDVFLGDMGVHSRTDGSRVRRLHAYEAVSRSERKPDARSHWSVSIDGKEHTTAECPEKGEDLASTTVRKVSLMLEHWRHCASADRRFRQWEDVVLDSFECNYEDHPVTSMRRFGMLPASSCKG